MKLSRGRYIYGVSTAIGSLEFRLDGLIGRHGARIPSLFVEAFARVSSDVRVCARSYALGNEACAQTRTSRPHLREVK